MNNICGVLNRSDGFTLIELLVVMTIISILSAFAIPQYQEYKREGFDLRAQHDLRNIAIAQEAYFLNNEEYLSCSDSGCSELPGIAGLSAGVTLAITADDSSFQGTASHPKGTGKVYQWDSETGGPVDPE